MTNEHTKTLSECQHNASVLAGMLEAIDLMANEGAMFDESRICVTIAAMDRAAALANDLDRLDMATKANDRAHVPFMTHEQLLAKAEAKA